MNDKQDRLRYSVNGYNRALQVSRTSLFVFVEGKTDRYFYGRIVEQVVNDLSTSVDYQIRMAQDLPAKTPGKVGLIHYFEHLKEGMGLLNRFESKTTATFFFFDKDIDDLLRLSLRGGSRHYARTKYYHFENYIFREGDLAHGLAASTATEVRICKAHMPDYESWRKEVAELWRDWVIICVFVKKFAIDNEKNYSVASRVNANITDPFDPLLLSSAWERIREQSTLTKKQFDIEKSKVSSMVADIYARGDHDLVFKGRWYALFLCEEMRKIYPTSPYVADNLPEKLVSTISLTLDFSAPWSDHLRSPLADLIKRL